MKDYIPYFALINIQPGLIFYNKKSDRACIVTGNDGLGLDVEEIELDPDSGLILNTIKHQLESSYKLPDYKREITKEIKDDKENKDV